ncbi:hypothetical protein Droror1_Dr00023603 [Drosera rotundifolia]
MESLNSVVKNIKGQFAVPKKATKIAKSRQATPDYEAEEEEVGSKSESAKEEIETTSSNEEEPIVEEKKGDSHATDDSESDESHSASDNDDEVAMKKREITKGKKPQVSDEDKEENEGEDDTKIASEDDIEAVHAEVPVQMAAKENKGKYKAISTRAILLGKIVKSIWLVQNGLEWLKTTLEKPKWNELFESDNLMRPEAVCEFYENVSKLKLSGERFMLKSRVNGREVVLTDEIIVVHLGIPACGFGNYGKGEWPKMPEINPLVISKKFIGNVALTKAESVNINSMTDENRLLFSLMVRGVVPKSSRKNEANGLDLTIIELLCRNEEVILPLLMMHHMLCIKQH